MTTTLDEFLLSCDEKRKDNPSFNMANEFKNLLANNPHAEAEIISSINAFKLTEITNQTKLEKSELALQEIYRGLKPFAIGRTALKGSEEMSLNFEASSLGLSESEVEDYEGNLQKIKKEGEDYYAFHDGEYRKCVISKPYEGYIALKFKVAYDLETEFLKKLEPLYYNQRGLEGKLTLSEIADRGMIRLAADIVTGKFEDQEPNELAKLIGSFAGKTSFLHLAVEKITPRDLEVIIGTIPENLRKAYLALPNSNGRRVIDMVTGDKASIINYHMNESETRGNNLANYSQNVHIASIHNSIDESFVKIANSILKDEKVEAEIENNKRKINFDHKKLENFTDKNIKALQTELNTLKQLKDEDLYENYIKPSLPKFKQNYDQKLVDFTKFQIEKSASLVEDVINNSHVGTNYQSDVNVVNNNGLSIKEMIAMSYSSLNDENKLIRAGTAYSDLKPEAQEICKLEAKMKFIDGLYSIRRGYNLDDGNDNKDQHKFSSELKDKNVCSGGTVNRLGDALNGIHADVELRVANPDSVKQKIYQLLPDVINGYAFSNSKCNTLMIL